MPVPDFITQEFHAKLAPGTPIPGPPGPAGPPGPPGADGVSGSPTPWTVDVDAAGHKLTNASQVLVGTDAAGDPLGLPVTVVTTGQAGAGFAHLELDPSGAAGVVLLNDGYQGCTLQMGGSGLASPIHQNNVTLASSTDFHIVTGSPATARVSVSAAGNVGISQSAPAHALDVTGDVNITGQYLVNGAPLALGGSSGPASSFAVFPTEAFPPSGTRHDFTGTIGFRFQVTRSLMVSALSRLWLSGNSQDHDIGLWNADTHVALATGTILNTAQSDSHGFKSVSISPVLLVPEVNYTIGSMEFGADDWKSEFALAGLVSAVILPDYSIYGPGAGLGEPTGTNTAGASLGCPAFTFTETTQTPWTSDIDAAGFQLNHAGSVQVDGNAIVSGVIASNPVNHTYVILDCLPGYQSSLIYREAGNQVWFAGTFSGIYRLYNVQRGGDDLEIDPSGVLKLPGYTSASHNFASDAAAAAGGIPIGGIYHNAGVLRVRLT